MDPTMFLMLIRREGDADRLLLAVGDRHPLPEHQHLPSDYGPWCRICGEA